MKKRWFILISPLLALTLVGMLSCSRQKTIETEEGKVSLTQKGDTLKIQTDEGTLTMDQGQMVIKTKKGEQMDLSVGEGSKLPDDFPQDIPIYEPSEVVASQVMSGGKNMMISLNTKDKPDKVVEFYKKSLAEQGWDVKSDFNAGNTSVLQLNKEKRSLSLTINKEEQGTLISLVSRN